MTIIITVTIIVIGVLWLLIRPDMSAVTGGLTTGVAGRKNTLIAIIVIAVGITILWIWRETVFAFPSMSALEQTMVLATVLFVVIATYGVWALYQKGDPVWPQRFAVAAMAGILILGGMTWMYGEAELSGATQQDLFVGDKPNAMGWTNLNGEFIVVHGLTPNDCVPAGYDAFDANGNMFPFAQTSERGSNECYKNGIPLVPNSQEKTPDVSGYTPQGIMGWLTTTPAEKAAEEAAEQAKIDAEQKRRIEIAKAKQPAPYDPTLEPITRVILACGTAWVEIAIPAKRTIHLPWNSAAATYEWRDSVTGQWVSKPQGSVDKVRICAKHPNYINDVMRITWSKA